MYQTGNPCKRVSHSPDIHIHYPGTPEHLLAAAKPAKAETQSEVYFSYAEAQPGFCKDKRITKKSTTCLCFSERKQKNRSFCLPSIEKCQSRPHPFGRFHPPFRELL